MEFIGPTVEPKPISGFWIIKRIEDDIEKYYTFECTVPSFEIENYVNNSEHVQYFVDRDAATDKLAEINDYTEI